MDFSNLTLCSLLQPTVSILQFIVDIMYLGLSFIGIQSPPVASWFNPILEPIFGCTVS